MNPTVTLSVVEGPLRGTTFVYDERTTAIAGRADDCSPQIVDAADRPTVSRHHCLFDINPPSIRVRDFGSLNGTHVNGYEIGRRRPDQTPEEGARVAYREADLSAGDRIKLGSSVLEVAIAAPPPEHANLTYDSSDGRIADDLIDSGGQWHWSFDLDDDYDPATAALQVAKDAGYEVIRELGRGGQGAVFLARQGSGNLGALKVLLAASGSSRAHKDFRREIAILAGLRHRNIVTFHDSGSEGGAFFFTSEYCDGGSVDNYVARTGPLSVYEAVHIVLQALEGLQYAHTAPLADAGVRRGVIHRDIKPANLLLSGEGRDRITKIGDFGLAKAFDSAGLSGHTMTGAVAGTMAFMPRPQMIDFKYAKPDVDVWAMAASLYWMLTGRTPREFPLGADPIGIVLGTDAVPIQHRNPAIPDQLASVIDRALIDRPGIVVTSAKELADRLRAAL